MTWNIETIVPNDAAYPWLLKTALVGADMPKQLYCVGDLSLLASISVAVIGTRNPNDSGMRVTFNTVKNLVPDFTIVAGLAKGIDTAAHASAIANGGKTIAVLVDVAEHALYPSENAGLAHEIVEAGGLLVAENPPSHLFQKRDFFTRDRIQRDRIQAALSYACIPIQAGMKSGTMHTVSFAEKYGRLLLAPSYPSAAEGERYEGIRDLIATKRATAYGSKEMPSLTDTVYRFIVSFHRRTIVTA